MARAKYGSTAMTVPLGGRAVSVEPNAEIYLYEAGTGTAGANDGTPLAATIYAGNSGGTTKSNPFTADAQGNYEFYLETGQDVKVVSIGTGTGILASDRERVLPAIEDIGLLNRTTNDWQGLYRAGVDTVNFWAHATWTKGTGAGARKFQIVHGTDTVPIVDDGGQVNYDGQSFWGPYATFIVKRTSNERTNQCSVDHATVNGGGFGGDGYARYDMSHVPFLFEHRVGHASQGIRAYYGLTARYVQEAAIDPPSNDCQHGYTYASSQAGGFGQALSGIARAQGDADHSVGALYTEATMDSTNDICVVKSQEITVRQGPNMLTSEGHDAKYPYDVSGGVYRHLYNLVLESGRESYVGVSDRAKFMSGHIVIVSSEPANQNASSWTGIFFKKNAIKSDGYAIDGQDLNGWTAGVATGTLPAAFMRIPHLGKIVSKNNNGAADIDIAFVDGANALNLYGGMLTVSAVGAVSGAGIFATTTVAATTTVTAGTGITATTGNIIASTGNIVATAGAVAAGTSVSATTNVVAGLNLYPRNQAVYGVSCPRVDVSIAVDATTTGVAVPLGRWVIVNRSAAALGEFDANGSAGLTDRGSAASFQYGGADPGSGSNRIWVQYSSGLLTLTNRFGTSQTCGVIGFAAA